jgi:hypothetical protein
MVGIGHSEPGKTIPHLISSADIVSIVVSYRVHHGRKWGSKLSHIRSRSNSTMCLISSPYAERSWGETKPSTPSRLAAKGVFYS